jgi:protein tyrosine phosphatase
MHYYIATQGPNDNTIEDFWQMCFQYGVNIIIMLCNVFEDNRKKCSEYWDIKTPKIFKVKNVNIIKNDDTFIEKEIEIQKIENNETRKFFHIQFKCWPDHQTPDPERAFHNFETLFKFVEEKKKKKSPIVIHCSAGIGRTGVFSAVQILYNEIMGKINTNQDIHFNIFNTVRKIKECRLYSVDNVNQYSFIYELIEELLKEKNK